MISPIGVGALYIAITPLISDLALQKIRPKWYFFSDIKKRCYKYPIIVFQRK